MTKSIIASELDIPKLRSIVSFIPVSMLTDSVTAYMPMNLKGIGNFSPKSFSHSLGKMVLYPVVGCIYFTSSSVTYPIVILFGSAKPFFALNGASLTKKTRLLSDLFMVIPFTFGIGTILRAVQTIRLYAKQHVIIVCGILSSFELILLLHEQQLEL